MWVKWVTRWYSLISTNHHIFEHCCMIGFFLCFQNIYAVKVSLKFLIAPMPHTFINSTDTNCALCHTYSFFCNLLYDNDDLIYDHHFSPMASSRNASWYGRGVFVLHRTWCNCIRHEPYQSINFSILSLNYSILLSLRLLISFLWYFQCILYQASQHL